MRSPLSLVIQRVSAIADQINALPEDERNYLLDLLLPEAEIKPKVKRKRKAATTASTKRRGLSEQVKGTLTEAVAGRCLALNETNQTCGEYASNAIHDPKGGYAGYHEFVAAKAASASGD